MKAALRDRTGLTVSVPELLVTMIIRFLVVGGLVVGIAAMLALVVTTTTSTQASSSFQSSSLRFDAAVAAADVVRGSSEDTVALMSNVDGDCQIVAWRNAEINGVLNLVTDTSTVDGECTTDTPIPADGVGERVALVSNVSPNRFVYENIAGRALVFDADGNASLSSAAKPDGVATQDWDDVRPQRVQFRVKALGDDLTTFAKQADLVGFARVINFTDPEEGIKFIPAGPPIVAPSAISNVTVTRSTTVGDLYSGTREGARISFLGGECQDTRSIVTVTWTPAYPAGQTAESAVFEKLVGAGRASFDIPRVRNGAEGDVTVAVKCSVSASPDSASSFYEQLIPATTLAVGNGATAENHDLSWTAVSSLPTTFGVTWAASPAKPGNRGDAGSTTALSKTVTYPLGTTYGFATNYEVTPNVSGTAGLKRTGGVTDLWPAAPTARNITYRGNGNAARITDGVISWSYGSSCPAGTVRSAREIQNTVFNSTTGQSSRGNYTVGAYAVNKTSAAWTPRYALQGHPYQERVDTKCSSPVTGSQSDTATAQSASFFTPMTSPSAPVYNGFDFRDFVRGDTVGFATCWNIEPTNCDRTFPKGNAIDGGGFFESYQMDYITQCPAGSKLGFSYYRTEKVGNPSGGNDRGFFGKRDGWQIGDSTNQAQYDHLRPVYRCDTLWTSSPISATGADIRYTLNRIYD